MNEKIDYELARIKSKEICEKFAEELVSVQPMPNSIMSDLLKHARSEEELIADGYEPADPYSPAPLMWIKKDERKD